MLHEQQRLLRMGIPLGQATSRATDFVSHFILGGGDKSRLHKEVAAIVANPPTFVDDPLRGEFAKALNSSRRPSSGLRPPSPAPAGEGIRSVPIKYHRELCKLSLA